MLRNIHGAALILFFILSINSPALAKTNTQLQNNIDSQNTRLSALPVFDEGDTSRTVVSEEEERSLSIEERTKLNAYLRQPAFQNITDHVISFAAFESSKSSKCPLSDYDVRDYLRRGAADELPEMCYYRHASYIHYPQNTGSTKVDKIIKAMYACIDPMNPPDNACLITYVIGRPSPRYISIAFCLQSVWRGTDAKQSWAAYNFDLSTGRPLALDDLFPDLESSGTLLRKYSCRRFWPEEAGAQCGSLDVRIDRFFLTQEGLYIINYLDGESGKSSDDFEIGYIPLADLAELGANTALWEK